MADWSAEYRLAVEGIRLGAYKEINASGLSDAEKQQAMDRVDERIRQRLNGETDDDGSDGPGSPDTVHSHSAKTRPMTAQERMDGEYKRYDEFADICHDVTRLDEEKVNAMEQLDVQEETEQDRRYGDAREQDERDADEMDMDEMDQDEDMGYHRAR